MIENTDKPPINYTTCCAPVPSVVYNEDCIQVMKRYPNKFFDLAVVDVPYGIGEDGASNHSRNKLAKATKYTPKSWDSKAPDKEYFDELIRVSKNQIVWGGNYFTDYLPPSMGWIMWDKGQRDFSLADGELAWTSFNKALRIFEMSRGKALAKNNEQGGRFHPTQKPEMLYSWILQNYAKAGDLILDTHLGSGSSRIAAYKGGFNFVGFEINEHYYEKQEKRFKDFISQLRLF